MAIFLGGRGGNMTENLQNRAKSKNNAPGLVNIEQAADISMIRT